MAKKVYVAPSTDPAKNTKNLILYAKQISPFADFLHVDVMDGKFVERATINSDIVKQVFNQTTLPFDVHLMAVNPQKLIKEFRKAGAVNITVHYEAFKTKKAAIRCLQNIKKLGIMCGISIKPTTAVSEIVDILSYVNIVLVMSVEPGKSGQKFIESSIGKIEELSRIKKEYGAKYLIEVDGGINAENYKKVIAAGADILVSGSFVYSAENKEEAIKTLKTF